MLLGWLFADASRALALMGKGGNNSMGMFDDACFAGGSIPKPWAVYFLWVDFLPFGPTWCLVDINVDNLELQLLMV